MKKRRIILILFSFFLFLSIGLNTEAAGDITCNAYCTGAGYSAGQCETQSTCAALAIAQYGSSNFPTCVWDTCLYNCYTGYGKTPCLNNETCFCMNTIDCIGCPAGSCTNSGCNTGCSAATCDLSDYCSGGNLYNYSCNTSSVCAYTGNSCTLACCQAYLGSTASCVSGVCTLPCSSAVCGGYNGYYAGYESYRFYTSGCTSNCYVFGSCNYSYYQNCSDNNGCSGSNYRTYSCSSGSCYISSSSCREDCCDAYYGNANAYCSGTTCVAPPKLPNGSSCTLASECTSNICKDGVCCDQACTGTCMECNINFYQGTCSYTYADWDPANECATGLCRTGNCNGSGACGWPSDDANCGSVSCSAYNTYYSSSKNCYYRTYNPLTSNRCSSLGVCKVANTTNCNSYGDALTVSCNADCQTLSGCTGATAGTCVNVANGTTCQTNKVCSSGVCIDKKSNGTTCTLASECTSNICKDGVCCDQACTGTCMECNINFYQGTCSYTYVDWDPANECATGLCRTGNCNGSGACGWPSDDANCVVNCGVLNNYSQVGQSCIYHTYSNLTSNRCESLGVCKVANTTNCGTPSDSTQITCGECKTVSGCNLTTPGSCITAPNGTNCGTGSTCQDGVCRKSNGSTCIVGTECISNSCSDGVCCNSSCSGTCQKCSLSGSVGTCTYISNGEDPDDECSGTNSCNGSGGCTTCSVLNPLTAPTDRWQRVWKVHSTGACLDNGPDETALQINQTWADGVAIAYGRSTDIEMQSVRTINIPTAGTYRFGLGSDDGVALSIDNGSTLVFEKWSDHTWPGSPEYMDAYLSAGNHTFELNYYNNGGGGQLTFVYSLLFPVCSRTSPVKNGNSWTITNDCWYHGNACYNDVDGVCDETCETKLAEGDETAVNTITIPQGLWDATIVMNNISGLAKCLGDNCVFNNDCSASLIGAGFTLYLDGEWLEGKQNDMNISATGDGIQESSGNGSSVSSVKQINCTKVGGCSLEIEKGFTSMVWTSNSMFGGDKPAYGYVQLKADISVSLAGITDTILPIAEIIEPPHHPSVTSEFYTSGSHPTKFRFSDSGGSGLKSCEYEIRNLGVITLPKTALSPCNGNGPIDFSSVLMNVGSSGDCKIEGPDNKCTIFLYVKDNAGNENGVFRSYGIDFTPPTTEIK